MTENNKARSSGLKIGTKLAIISILISMMAVTASSMLSGYSSTQALKRAAFERLTAVRELKAQQIEHYFSQVEDELKFISESAYLKENFQRLRRGVVYIQASKDLVTPQSQEKLSKYYFCLLYTSDAADDLVSV